MCDDANIRLARYWPVTGGSVVAGCLPSCPALVRGLGVRLFFLAASGLKREMLGAVPTEASHD